MRDYGERKDSEITVLAMVGEHRLVGIKFTRSIREVQIMANFMNYKKRMASI